MLETGPLEAEAEVFVSARDRAAIEQDLIFLQCLGYVHIKQELKLFKETVT